jgi:hypothetical protein
MYPPYFFYYYYYLYKNKEFAKSKGRPNACRGPKWHVRKKKKRGGEALCKNYLVDKQS